jgi:hypothetical protein
MTDTSAPSLDVGLAIRDGWQAFCRAPWPFVGFIVLTGILSQLATLIPGIGWVASIVINLWGGVGLIRGSWIALEGRTLRFADLTGWDGQAALRLFTRQLVLGLLISLIVLVMISLAFVASGGPAMLVELVDKLVALTPDEELMTQELLSSSSMLGERLVTSPLAGLSFLIVGVLLLYLQVNQAFLGFIALLEGRGPIGAIQRGRAVVDGQWWQVLGLLILETLILFIGFVMVLVGLLAAVPLTFCISGAAYRQLFGTEDQAGLLNGQ